MYGARFQQQNEDMKKPFQATKLPGTVKRQVYRYKQTSTRVTARGHEVPVYTRVVEEVVEAAGHIVKFAFGHSIRVRAKTEARQGLKQGQMTHMGYDAEPGLVHMLTGDVVVPNREKVADRLELSTLLPTNYSTPVKGAKHASS